MWLLTCDGDLFDGKRRWLRPGSVHLLGRTTAKSEDGQRTQYIEHKSVSRKHLTIEVAQVKQGEEARIYARSQITVKEGSKMGTTVNGERISQETRTLDGKDYTFKLGSYPHSFHLWWHPVTLSFTSISKKVKDEHLAAQRARFAQTDIKLITEYVTNETSHCIVKKRNTAEALQTLLQAKWLVTDGFVEALAAAIELRDVNEPCILEADFDENWPNEADYPVESGTEPHPRPNSYLKPDPQRTEVFRDYTFVFLAQSQYDRLLPVVTAGSGKALLYDVQPDEMEAGTVVEYVKEVAGRKGDDSFRLSQYSGKGGVVVVRLTERDETGRKFMRSIDLALDQRSVEQNEFLDAILAVDASSLRRQLAEEPDSTEPSGSVRASDTRVQIQVRHQERAATVARSPAPAEPEQPRTQAAQPVAEEQPLAEQPIEEASEQPTATKRRNRRFITQSRFKGFDDFDPSQFAEPASQDPEQSFENQKPSQAASVQDMEVDESTQPPRTQQSTRKRPAPQPDDFEDESDMYASMMTGHAAMKRRRTEATQNGKTDSTDQPSTEAERKALEKAAKTRKKAKEMDVMAEVHARRKREDEQRQKDEDALREALDGVEISELKDLAKVEEMEIPVRERPVRRAGEDGRSERWDPAWNGRKNFKKFRPQGQRQDGPRLQRVIVTLEEVPRKGHGIGEQYWPNGSTSGRSKSKSQSQSQSVRQGAARPQDAGEDDEDSARFQRRLQNSRQEDEEQEDVEQTLREESPGRTRDHIANSTPSQTFGTDSQRKAAGKRPAAKQGGGPAKKPRQSRLAHPAREVVDLDDDDLKFRRRGR